MERVGPETAHLKSSAAWIPTFPIKIQSLYVWTLRVCKRELQGFHLRAFVARFPFVHLNDLMETQKKNPKLPPKSFHPSGSWKWHLKHLFSLRLWQMTQNVWKHHSLAKLRAHWRRMHNCDTCDERSVHFKTCKTDKNHWAFFSNCCLFCQMYLPSNFYCSATLLALMLLNTRVLGFLDGSLLTSALSQDRQQEPFFTEAVWMLRPWLFFDWTAQHECINHESCCFFSIWNDWLTSQGWK